ncbi:hypothetical protein BGZ73_007477 [Actinomortierella ambigua]|nr:hypothetical protein BGZ73_007477 [Actinomortierella ambigua]
MAWLQKMLGLPRPTSQTISMKRTSTQTLNGTWTLSNKDETILIAATVPGQVHDALLQSGFLTEDPYFGLNYVDEKFRALIHDTWTYTRTFKLSDKPIGKVFLDCHGLDTLATIQINGQTATKTNNQFRRYVTDITPFVTAGENTIAISFDDATRYAMEAAKAYPYYAFGVPSNFTQ